MNSDNKLGRKGRRVLGCFGLAFGSLFLGIGLFICVAALSRSWKQHNTAGWKSVPGEVISVNVKFTEEKMPESPMLYSYTVDGKVYRSTRAAYVDVKNLSYNDWLALINGLPQKGPVTVYYNPAEPEESVLRAGKYANSSHGLGLGAMFAGFAAVWMAFWWGMSNWLPSRLERSRKSDSGGDSQKSGYSRD
jgi:hypothetical protein